MLDASLTRPQVRAWLDERRRGLFDCLATLTPEAARATPVTPLWNAELVLRHLWAWHTLGLWALDDWPGPYPWAPPPGESEDETNDRLQAQFTNLDLATLPDQLTTAYDRYADILDTATDTALAQTGHMPWGARGTLLNLIDGLTGHDAEHAAQIVAGRQALGHT